MDFDFDYINSIVLQQVDDLEKRLSSLQEDHEALSTDNAKLEEDKNQQSKEMIRLQQENKSYEVMLLKTNMFLVVILCKKKDFLIIIVMNSVINL